MKGNAKYPRAKLRTPCFSAAHGTGCILVLLWKLHIEILRNVCATTKIEIWSHSPLPEEKMFVNVF